MLGSSCRACGALGVPFSDCVLVPVSVPANRPFLVAPGLPPLSLVFASEFSFAFALPFAFAFPFAVPLEFWFWFWFAFELPEPFVFAELFEFSFAALLSLLFPSDSFVLVLPPLSFAPRDGWQPKRDWF